MKPRVEPSASQRIAATEVRALYLAYRETGFTRAEALRLAEVFLNGCYIAAIVNGEQ